ncbi:MAG: ABC transporter ATP-binding protein [Lachnospiraceae bacterium]|nr:ABC transporter ATP-binding protein [Lachnospiraceae bacterium]
MNTILKLKNVRKQYGKKEILKGIDLEVKEGEIISVLGPSGCGKSTLLNIIAGIQNLDDGEVWIYDKEVSSRQKTLRIEERNINMVFQDFALWPHMKARDNILYGLKVKKTGKAQMEERLEEVVSLLHLEGLLEQYPSELSGGQQQRVAIARALITKPAIILLDEPLCNLDVQLRIEMRTEMAQLFHSLKTTVFHVTHDPSEAFAMADRIIVMNGGQIDQIDKPIMCYIHPKTGMVAGLLGAGNCLQEGVYLSDAACEEEYCIVRYGSHSLSAMSFLPKDISADSNLELRFRPEECSFSKEYAGNAIPVTVVMSSFEGGQYRVKVETENAESVCTLCRQFLNEGEKGYIYIREDKVYAYEKADI